MPSIFDYIKKKDENFLDGFYGGDTIQSIPDQALNCKACFQSLSTLAKNYVMRLIYLPFTNSNNGFKIRDLSDWIIINNIEEHRNAVKELIKYNILKMNNKNNTTYINIFYCESLKFALSSCMNPMANNCVKDIKILSSKPSIYEIESVCNERWHRVLNT